MEPTNVLWTLFSLFMIGISYFAGFTFILGLLWRLYGYLRAPMPLPTAVTPAPTTESGAVGRVLSDVVLFPNLFKADKALWTGSIIFHHALAFILFRHLRYFTYPVPKLVLYMEPVALILGYLFGIAVLFLFWRRMALKRTLYVSNLPDYFALVLLGAIAATGILVSYWAHAYLVDAKAFILGLLTLHPVAPPAHPLFLIHYSLVLMLLLYFPFSKLLHAGGIFFSPTHTQPYEIQVPGKRYVNPLEGQQ